VYLEQGKLGPETEGLYCRALSIFSAVHGTDRSINASTILQNMSVLLFHRGQLQQAEALLRKGLRMKEELQGAAHPDNAHLRANMAYIYGHQGRVTEAVDLYEDALATLIR
jgi:tetratricopeptide (TPR) repeat protein